MFVTHLDLLSKQGTFLAHVLADVLQVSDNYVGLDLLGTQLDLRVGNFRKINIKTIPVYGMAQPTNDVSEAPRGFGELGRRTIYFQGVGEHW